ncbi:hypothetical protein L1987_59778 [Smallanthus sonchifolius]|uniref:Uncharacterized protein n=1 Tax=Smallanthus sonchifolius TaxID=185202 RepID=A0ACB9D6T4_9ASTR|nr:hypothetical protein L1987_59778 [Smallanthus sonchifolius]
MWHDVSSSGYRFGYLVRVKFTIFVWLNSSTLILMYLHDLNVWYIKVLVVVDFGYSTFFILFGTNALPSVT